MLKVEEVGRIYRVSLVCGMTSQFDSDTRLDEAPGAMKLAQYMPCTQVDSDARLDESAPLG
jgi:hypothetical protein